MYTNTLKTTILILGILLPSFITKAIPSTVYGVEKSPEQKEVGYQSQKKQLKKDNSRSIHLNIPSRSPQSMTGTQFMKHIEEMSFSEREQAILHELKTGNIPSFLRKLVEIEALFYDVNNKPHNILFRATPDYLSIGSDKDFCRIPMGPITAQKVANLYGACLPTRKIVDYIYKKADIKLKPVSYWPVGNRNELVTKFTEHNRAIEKLRIAKGGELGQLIAGIKKDVVLSNKIIDPSRPSHVVIYGWHKLDGIRIQPLTNIHWDWYVDYSHGIRLIDDHVIVDGRVMMLHDLLSDPTLFRIFSDEEHPMKQVSYISEGQLQKIKKK